MPVEIEFKDYSVRAVKEIEQAALNFLEEAGALIESKAKENTRVESGDTRKKWEHVLDDSELMVTIGNTSENAIWEEFGTGEFALYGNGRNGGWWIPEDQLDSRTKDLLENKYHFQVKHGKGGKKFYYTIGKQGTKALTEAWKSSLSDIDKRAKSIFKGRLNKE